VTGPHQHLPSGNTPSDTLDERDTKLIFLITLIPRRLISLNHLAITQKSSSNRAANVRLCHHEALTHLAIIQKEKNSSEKAAKVRSCNHELTSFCTHAFKSN